MSDDIDPELIFNANSGIVLPNDSNATHNAGLSPLFQTKPGFVDGRFEGYYYGSAVVRGSDSYFWATNNLSTDRFESYYTAVNHAKTWPSPYGPRVYGFSLRCLVSTN